MEAHHAVMHAARVNQLVLIVKQPVLNHDRDLVFTCRQSQLLLLGIAHQHRACQALVDLAPGDAVGVWVIKDHARPVTHFELVDEGLSLVQCVHRMPIHQGRHVQAMPVRDRWFVEFVAQMDPYLLPVLEAHQRSQVGPRQHGQRILGAVHQPSDVLLYAGCLPGQDRYRTGPADQFQFHIRLEVGRSPVGCHSGHVAHALHGPEPRWQAGISHQAETALVQETAAGNTVAIAHITSSDVIVSFRWPHPMDGVRGLKSFSAAIAAGENEPWNLTAQVLA